VSNSIPSLPELLPKIGDNEATEFFNKIIEQPVTVSKRISNYPIPATLIKLEKRAQSMSSLMSIFGSSSADRSSPIVLLHGFDSSCLEFRRLAPLLSADATVYVPDILGWGYTNLSNVEVFDPEAKIEYLKALLEQIVKKPCVLVGASLGGGIAMILASRYPNLIKKVVLIDAQGFIDGQGPSNIPDAISK
jgi:pimeloyl-ACP methyl ester carboxylesterase